MHTYTYWIVNIIVVCPWQLSAHV